MSRQERIKQRLFDKEYLTKQEWWGDGETILTSDEVRDLPLIVRKALAIRHVAAHMPIELKPDELIVGVPTMASVGLANASRSTRCRRNWKRRRAGALRRNRCLATIC